MALLPPVKIAFCFFIPSLKIPTGNCLSMNFASVIVLNCLCNTSNGFENLNSNADSLVFDLGGIFFLFFGKLSRYFPFGIISNLLSKIAHLSATENQELKWSLKFLTRKRNR